MRIKRITVKNIKSFKDATVSISPYTAFVGENNAGKSNFLFALRWFFGEVKLSKADIFLAGDGDPEVVVEFEMEVGVDGDSPGGNRIIRATVDKEKVLSSSMAAIFYQKTEAEGWSELAKPDFGKLVYVPSIREATEELKMTAKSSLNVLASEYVVARIDSEEEKENYIKQINDLLTRLTTFMSTGRTGALSALKEDIDKKMLQFRGVDLEFVFRDISAEELVKQAFTPKTRVEGIEESFEVAAQGDGYKRSLVVALLILLAEQRMRTQEKGKKGSKVVAKSMFYIVEEPELFLHPNYQTYFRNKLEQLSSSPGSQVIVTSHSPYFLNNVKFYSQIKRVRIAGVESKIFEVSDSDIDEICNENGELMVAARAACPGVKMSKKEMDEAAKRIAKDDHVRYLLWIDPARANAFLSKKIILVEGSTEKALFSYLFNNPDGPFYRDERVKEVTVLDVVGKFHVFKFASLLKKFGIDVWCVYDTDNGKTGKGISHEELNKQIEALKAKEVILDTLKIEPYLEKALGLEKNEYYPDISLYSNLEKSENKCKETKFWKSLIGFVENILKK